MKDLKGTTALALTAGAVLACAAAVLASPANAADTQR